MNEISGISTGHLGSVGRGEPLARLARPVEVPVRRDSDRVEVSREAREAREASRDETVRRDLVDRVRREIDAGTYESEERVSLAADALLLKLNKPQG